MRSPKTRVAPATTGSAITATSVSGRSIHSMPASATAALATVLVPYMIAGPQTMRTAPRSEAERASRSPVG